MFFNLIKIKLVLIKVFHRLIFALKDFFHPFKKFMHHVAKWAPNKFLSIVYQLHKMYL